MQIPSKGWIPHNLSTMDEKISRHWGHWLHSQFTYVREVLSQWPLPTPNILPKLHSSSIPHLKCQPLPKYRSILHYASPMMFHVSTIPNFSATTYRHKLPNSFPNFHIHLHKSVLFMDSKRLKLASPLSFGVQTLSQDTRCKLLPSSPFCQRNLSKSSPGSYQST